MSRVEAPSKPRSPNSFSAVLTMRARVSSPRGYPPSTACRCFEACPMAEVIYPERGSTKIYQLTQIFQVAYFCALESLGDAPHGYPRDEPAGAGRRNRKEEAPAPPAGGPDQRRRAAGRRDRLGRPLVDRRTLHREH